MHRLLYAEYLPWVIKRWEHVKNPLDAGSYIWSYIGWPPNQGQRRDIPSNALFHRSVINRMDLRTICYVPNNFLWVQKSGTPDVVEKNLSELTHRCSPKYCDRESETQPLVKPDIEFVLANDLTTGSVSVEGQNVEIGVGESEGIYRVVLDSH